MEIPRRVSQRWIADAVPGITSGNHRALGTCVCVLIVLTASIVPPAASPSAVVECSSPGDWPHTADAAWLARALVSIGLGSFGCTGSAFVVDLGGNLSEGQIYVWTTRGRTPLYLSHRVRVDGVIVRRDHVRGAWRARGLNVWVQTASARSLLPSRRWARVVSATRSTRR